MLTDRRGSALGAAAAGGARAFGEGRETADPGDPQRAGVPRPGPVCKRIYLTGTLASHGPVGFGNVSVWVLQKLT